MMEAVAWQRRLKRKEQAESEWGTWRECSEQQANYVLNHGHPEDYPMVDAQVRPLTTIPEWKDTK